MQHILQSVNRQLHLPFKKSPGLFYLFFAINITAHHLNIHVHSSWDKNDSVKKHNFLNDILAVPL